MHKKRFYSGPWYNLSITYFKVPNSFLGHTFGPLGSRNEHIRNNTNMLNNTCVIIYARNECMYEIIENFAQNYSQIYIYTLKFKFHLVRKPNVKYSK